MPLEFAICGQCNESHARQANGRMSIHTTAAGERCAPAASTPRRATPQRREPAPTRRDDDDELQAAFEVSRTQPRRRGSDAPDRLDRRIYATERAEVLRGGLPTLGRRAH
ncbi:hypothetical protein PUY80_15525 [Plantibacter flavus]|uniref:hypothetical protein n=1 Tax=Plantibacter flavus TaxID=150123 RepID=UPI00237989B2|nr:hypothetical protein [Plantibacter flavus]MDD9153980.1 hypothetical protein [Plantibacter flavus]